MIKKIIAFFILYPIYFISFIIPRNKMKWVFGTYGSFNDNSKYLYISVLDNYPDITPIWITTKLSELKSLRDRGINAYYKYSFSGFFHCLTSGKYFYSAYISDINFYTSGGAIKINLWHGVGLKKIEFNIDSGPLYKLYNGKYKLFNSIIYPSKFIRPDYFLSSSPLMTNVVFKDAFRIEADKCLEFGYPRNDIFSWNNEDLESFITKYESNQFKELLRKIEHFDKVILYMPTWRDSNSDFISELISSNGNLSRYLKDNNILFLVKLHPNTELDTSLLEKNLNIVRIDSSIDVYPLFSYTSGLITDYSSVYYDYILLKDKWTLLFPHDFDNYMGNSRDLILDYYDYTEGPYAYSIDELLEEIKNVKVKKNSLVNTFWNKNTDNAGKHLIEFFLKL